MKGIIIAGGQGTRLRPLTYERPKPLVPLVNRPFLEYQVALLKTHGIDEVVFATNYMAEKIQEHFGDGSRFGVKMHYAVEETPLGTGGAIRNAADLFPGESVAVFNGDVLTDFDLQKILSFHRDMNAIATITLQPIPAPNPFGVLLLDDRGEVQSWREPTEEEKKALANSADSIQTGTDLINAGFYVFDRKFIDSIPAGTKSSVERDIFPPLIAGKAGIYGIAPGGYWMDLGRPEQFIETTRAILTRSVKTFTDDQPIRSSDTIAATATITGLSTIGSNVSVGAGTTIEDCVIMDGVTVGENCTLRNLIVDQNTEIQADTTLIGQAGGVASVVAAGSVIKSGTRVQA